MIATTQARPRAVVLDLLCQLLSFRLGRWEVHAQREASPLPAPVAGTWSCCRTTRPGPGELVVDLPRWSLAMTNHRRRDAARAGAK